MNQDIFAQLQQDQDTFNAYQDRFKNELMNFDMDKQTQRLTQAATQFATDQARKASSALSNQLFGQDITQTAVEAAPLLYKSGKYLKDRLSGGLSGAANDITDAAQDALGKGSGIVQDAKSSVLAKVEGLAPERELSLDQPVGVAGQLNPGQRGDTTLARAAQGSQDEFANVRGQLPSLEELRGVPAQEAAQPFEGAPGILGMNGGRYTYDVRGGTIRDADTGAQPDFGTAPSAEERSTIFSRDADVSSFEPTPGTQQRLDSILGVQEREQLQSQSIPEFQRPVQPASNVASDAARAPETNPSIGSELPTEDPDLLNVRAPPLESLVPEAAEATAARAAAEGGEAAKLGEEATEGAGLAEDAAEPEVAAVTEGVDLLADSRIPGVSTLAKGVEDVGSNVAKVVDDIPGVSSVEKGLKSVGDDLEEGFEDLFGGSKKADPLPSAAPQPQAPALRDSLAPMREGMTGDFEKDFPAVPTSGASPELQSRLGVLQREAGPATDEELQDRATKQATKVAPPSPPDTDPKADADKVATQDKAELPGVGETLMGATALAGLGVAAEEQQHQDLGGGSVAMPSGPAAPMMSSLAFEAAPTIDSTNFHNF